MNQLIEQRITDLRKILAEKNIDTFMVLVGENRRYLSGFTGEDGQFDETAGVLFITDSRLVFATDSRFELQAAREAPLYDTFVYRESLPKSLGGILGDLNTRRLGFESARMAVSQYREIEKEIGEHRIPVDLIALEEIVEKQRVVKQTPEIEATKNALALAERVFVSVVKTLEAGMTEESVAWAMEKGMREGGAQALSFPTIVAYGPNSALPHAIPGDRPLKEGEPILFDWGARLDGYCSDTSRTLILGKPDDTFKKVHQTVCDAQKMAIDAIKSGVSSKTVDAVARNFIDKSDFKGTFGHGLGHGTGLAIHEAPRLSPIKETILESGMLVTVEPGIYLPEWGGVRIEHQVVVRDDGAEILNELGISYSVEDY
jgi:Xaa-Pro aminopeptidase